MLVRIQPGLPLFKGNPMKVVINTCFGGFSLSSEAMKLLIKRKSKGIEAINQQKYYNGSDLKRTFQEIGDGYCIEKYMPDVLVKDNKVYSFDRHIDSYRNDPILVQVVEELGEKADGDYGKLAIIEVPDGTNWSIEDYNGRERVDESHRSWS